MGCSGFPQTGIVGAHTSAGIIERHRVPVYPGVQLIRVAGVAAVLSSGVEQSVLSITTLLKAAELTKDLPTDERPGILARPTEVRPLQQDPTNHGARCVLEYKCHNLKVLIHPEQLAVGRWRMGRVSLSLRERRSLEQIVRLQRVEARRYRRARMGFWRFQ